MDMKIAILVPDVIALQVRIIILIFPCNSAIVVCFFLLIFFLKNLCIICGYAQNLRVYNVSLKMTIRPRLCWPRLKTWPEVFLYMLDKSLSFFYRSFQLSLIWGWVFTNSWLLAIPVWFIICKKWESKIYNKYKSKKYVTKIENVTQRIWWLKLTHILNLD